MALSTSNPLWVIILVGALSGVIGAVVGPITQRVFGRSDRALDARQVWAKEKLQTVFGVGDEWVATDGPVRPFMRLVPPSGSTPQMYDMHSINWALLESVDYMLLQPRRSKWARHWLYNWHFVLQPEARLLHTWLHDLRQRGVWEDDAWRRANAAYERKVARVQSSLAIWSTGQWLSHSSLRLWLSSTNRVHASRQRNSSIRKLAPAELRGGEWQECDCFNIAALDQIDAEIRAAEGRLDSPDESQQ
jgi:hypothetical protein